MIDGLDHYAISPQGFVPGGGRVVLRVLALRPRLAAKPGLRFRVQACEPCGLPVAEDPLIALEDAQPDEVSAFVATSTRDGWQFIPRTSAHL